MNISNFIEHTVLIICRCEQNVLLNKSLKFRFIYKTTAKVIRLKYIQFMVMGLDWLIDWLLIWCFTSYRQYFSQINTVTDLALFTVYDAPIVNQITVKMIIRNVISTNKVYRIQRLLYCTLYLYHVITIKLHFYIQKGKIIRFNIFFKSSGSGEH